MSKEVRSNKVAPSYVVLATAPQPLSLSPKLRNAGELALMRQAGRIVAQVHEDLKAAIRPGTSTVELNAIAADAIRSRNAVPTFLHYQGGAAGHLFPLLFVPQ